MEKPILSIIVPVYNVENFIKECIDSLIAQTIKSVEIIVVNDGSKDSSMDIVKEYNNEKIKIVNKENGGLSSARNAGIKVAQGKYMAFVDSDDFISNNTAYEDMVSYLEKSNSDIIVGMGSWYYNQNKIIPMNKYAFKDNIISSEEYLITSIREHRIFVPVWLNIIKSSILKDNNLYFTEGILHEDEMFSTQLFLKAKKVIIYNENFYMYRQRQGSIMNSNKNKDKRLKDVQYICESLNNITKDIKNMELREEYMNYIAFLGLESIYSVKGKVNKNFKKVIKNNSMRNSLKRSAFYLNINVNLYYVYEYCKRKTMKFIIRLGEKNEK